MLCRGPALGVWECNILRALRSATPTCGVARLPFALCFSSSRLGLWRKQSPALRETAFIVYHIIAYLMLRFYLMFLIAKARIFGQRLICGSGNSEKF